MADVSVHIHASPNAVFAILADGWLYSTWVVGNSHVRAVESDWPDPGSRLHHCSGVWPVVTRDETLVEKSEPARRLELYAKGGPLGAVRIVIELEPDGDGTRVSLAEAPVTGLGKWLHNPINDKLLARRNTETLARLAAVSERRTQPSD
jgi:uncharacterized protein YndB with AHSA1/START domain